VLDRSIDEAAIEYANASEGMYPLICNGRNSTPLSKDAVGLDRHLQFN